MSTGATPQIAELAPPSNGHARGHSRTRGHNRSRQWAQPPSLSLESSNGSPPKPPLPDDAAHSSYSYGHASQPSFSLHTPSPSHSFAHHDHSHSVTSIHHDAAHGNDMKEEVAALSEGRPEQIQEILSGGLIALPWIALSWYAKKYTQRDQLKNDSDTASDVMPSEQKACVLTAIILILFGCGQVMRMKYQKRRAMSSSSAKFPPLSTQNVQSAVLHALSIGLPIYAALKIGSFIVAFAVLFATATGVPSLTDATAAAASKERYGRKPLTIALIGSSTILSFFGMNQPWDSSPLIGYVALMLSVFVVPPPFPSIRQQWPIPEPGLVAEFSSKQALTADANQLPVIVTIDARHALVSGGSLALLCLIISRGLSFGAAELFYLLIPSGLFAISMMIAVRSGLRSANKIGLAVSAGAAALLCALHVQDEYFVYAARGILVAASFFASRMDDRHLRIDARSPNHSHHHHSHSHSHNSKEASGITKWLIDHSESYPLLSSILKEKDSRSIFYFMCLNFAFMLVQLSYGIVTGSLGLLSDSIHMFFDCLALVVGLCAAVMSKWPPNARFPYGYGKVDTLSGFANGIFLMIISVEIIYEAVERLSSGSQMHRIGELLAVSVAGLVVNLVGIFSFEHGHHHGHDHGHSHGNENMHGIFLHILADTLGSVAVVVSTVLVHYSGWSGYDPLASCFIAILIFASAVPLVSSTAQTLLLTLPADTEYNVRETLAGVSTLRGVVSYTVPKFWLDDTSADSSDHAHGLQHPAHGSCGHNHDHSHHDDHDHDHDHSHDHDHAHANKSQRVFGVIHVIASRGSDLEDVRQRTVNYLQEKNMAIVVQVERGGDGRCWCGGGNKSP